MLSMFWTIFHLLYFKSIIHIFVGAENWQVSERIPHDFSCPARQMKETFIDYLDGFISDDVDGFIYIDYVGGFLFFISWSLKSFDISFHLRKAPNWISSFPMFRHQGFRQQGMISEQVDC